MRDYQFYQSFSEIWLIKRGQQFNIREFRLARTQICSNNNGFTLESTTDRLLSHHRITNFVRLSICPAKHWWFFRVATSLQSSLRAFFVPFYWHYVTYLVKRYISQKANIMNKLYHSSNFNMPYRTSNFNILRKTR